MGTVQRSTDMGRTWQRSEGLGLPEESGLKLASTWHLEPGHESEPGTLWPGGEPGVLFRSDGRNRFEVDAATVGDALRSLPVADLVLDEHGAVRPLVHVYVEGERAHDLAAALASDARVRIVAAIAGG